MCVCDIVRRLNSHANIWTYFFIVHSAYLCQYGNDNVNPLSDPLPCFILCCVRLFSFRCYKLVCYLSSRNPRSSVDLQRNYRGCCGAAKDSTK